MGGSCSMPLAAHAILEGGALHLRAAWGEPEVAPGLLRAQGQVSAPSMAQAEALGERVAAELQAAGAH
jgi:hydroxymethylbilane synthase